MQKLSQKQAWQTALMTAITDPAELLQILELDSAFLAPAATAAARFGLRVPRNFVARMQKNSPADPLLRQILPLAEEQADVPEYSSDPLQEREFNPVPGLLHKYYGRVLLTVTGHCGVNCRYCFRREFPYKENVTGQAGWQPMIEYIRTHPEISEVILSGGDPLIATDMLLEKLSDQLLTIPQVKTLRIHTRIPIVLPERITPEFIAWLSSLPWRKVLVLHCNHPQELSADVYAALAPLRNANITLLNQSVLLKGVNDKAETLIALSEALFNGGILPYYLHMLDKVRGAAHFAVPLAVAQNLMKDLQAQLPGYLVPRLVSEAPGAKSKVLITFA